jgi:hypothetical protein
MARAKDQMITLSCRSSRFVLWCLYAQTYAYTKSTLLAAEELQRCGSDPRCMIIMTIMLRVLVPLRVCAYVYQEQAHVGKGSTVLLTQVRC